MQRHIILWTVAYTFLGLCLFHSVPNPAPIYFLLISALCIAFYTDTCYMLISRFTSLYLVPIGIGCAYFKLLPICTWESIAAASAGYLFFWTTNYIFYQFKKCDGLGQGDMDLIACIGAFLGFAGIWFTITASSIIGTLYGIAYLWRYKKSTPPIPFGALLAPTAIIFIFLA